MNRFTDWSEKDFHFSKSCFESSYAIEVEFFLKNFNFVNKKKMSNDTFISNKSGNFIIYEIKIFNEFE